MNPHAVVRAMSSSNLEVSALGQPASLGGLYDARTHRVLPALSLWDAEQLSENVTRKETPGWTLVASTEDSVIERMDKMDLSGDVQCEVAAGIFKAEAAGSLRKYYFTLYNSDYVSFVLPIYCLTLTYFMFW